MSVTAFINMLVGKTFVEVLLHSAEDGELAVTSNKFCGITGLHFGEISFLRGKFLQISLHNKLQFNGPVIY